MDEFKVHLLNEAGLAKAKQLEDAFTTLLASIEQIVPVSRERSLVVTKLQEASFWAKRGIAVLPENAK
jgi:hypothetical protein